MTTFLRPVLLASAALLCSAAHALTVNVPSFTELVAKAELIARTEVIGVRSQRQPSPTGQPIIVTIVTFKVEERLKGSSPEQFEFTQLGGQVADEGLQIAGLPTWQMGDRDIVFVAGNGKVVCPLVGIPHGRFWIVTTGTSEYVARSDGSALVSTDDVSAPLGQPHPADPTAPKAAGAAEPLTVAAFAAAVRAELTRAAAASTGTQ